MLHRQQFLQERPIIYVLCRSCHAKHRASNKFSASLGKHKTMKPLDEHDKEIVLTWLGWARDSLHQRAAANLQPLGSVVATAEDSAQSLLRTAQERLKEQQHALVLRQNATQDAPIVEDHRLVPHGVQPQHGQLATTVKPPKSILKPPRTPIPISDDSSTLGDDEDVGDSDTSMDDPDWLDILETQSQLSARSNSTPRPARRRFVRPTVVSALSLPKSSSSDLVKAKPIAPLVVSQADLAAAKASKQASKGLMVVHESFPASVAAEASSSSSSLFQMVPAGSVDLRVRAQREHERRHGKLPEAKDARRMMSKLDQKFQKAAQIKTHVEQVNKDPLTRIKQKSRALVGLETAVQAMTKSSSSASFKVVNEFLAELSGTFMSTARDDFTLTLSGRERPVGFLVPDHVKALLAHWLVLSRKRAAELHKKRQQAERERLEQERMRAEAEAALLAEEANQAAPDPEEEHDEDVYT